MSEQPPRMIETPFAAALQAGVARRAITPPVGIYARNWGAAKHDVAEGIHRPLTATVLCLQQDADADLFVLASMDLGRWKEPDGEWFVRRALIEALGIDVANIILSVTHTHAGPSLNRADADKPGGALIEAYLADVRDALIDAAKEALQQQTAATLTWARGSCALACNRDLSDPEDSRVICGYNPRADADDTLLLGRLTDHTGRIIATLVNYACHPTTLAWDNRLISPDYIGATREVVETHTGGVPCLFLQGASGELAPREQYVGDTDIADSNGRQLGFAALAALESMLPAATTLQYGGTVESGAPVAIWKRTPFAPSRTLEAKCINVELPVKNLPSESELQGELDQCADRTMAERLRRKLRVVQTVGSGPTCTMPAWIWRVGQSFIVGQPNEAYAILQTRLRERFPDFAVVVMNLVNGACGYLYPPELASQNIYQVWQSPFDHGALDILVDTCEQLIASMIRGSNSCP